MATIRRRIRTSIRNYLYYRPGGPTSALKLGLFGSTARARCLSDNYVANGVMTYCDSMTINGNLLRIGRRLLASQFPNNSSSHLAQPV